MSYPVDREPEVNKALDCFLTSLGHLILDMQYSQSEIEPLSADDQAEFNARFQELVDIQLSCRRFKSTLWNGELTNVC